MNNPHSAGGGTGGGNTGGGKRRRHNKQHQQRNNSHEVASSAVLLDDANDLNYSVHHSHSYPAAPSYDMRRDSNQSRNRRGDIDNWQQRGEPSHSVHDRGYDDLPRRNGTGRNSYDRLDRDGEGWAVVDPYGPSGRDWKPTEEYPQQGYASYGDAGYNSGRRGMGYDWVEDERRLPPENGRRFSDDGARGWRDNGQQRFVSDSGWDGRFVENREAAPYLEEPRPEESSRNWEPAPGWKQNQNTVPITNTGTSATNNDRGMATPASLVISTTIITIAVIDRGNIRARSGKTRISSGRSGSSRKTRTPTSSSFTHPLHLGWGFSLNT
jgi:hypothetical protein